ncbi:hypothetical protein GCM10010840_29720 [Deinococcus aerolatus]|uniref:GGDEF domain-containing protein n=1 Tax=Deinococcus aerolatus TaxID=522487 RepID=A0ABQ2GEH9_9DEIO|nr:GGDEF domain-containing protein [Deinococcus aerolatus]GGL89671.1 hypothetical protein GCM10010840_29720 [Deinococcus aerolatus]
MTSESAISLHRTIDLTELLPITVSPQRGAGTADLRADLRAVQAQAADLTLGAGERFRYHREAAYHALDLHDITVAMEHALKCLQLARASGDGPSQVKAHVTLALAMMEAYDDVGAQREFLAARTLAARIDDHRGMALVAVNASHLELERRKYPQAARHLLDLLVSPHMRGLMEADARQLWRTFHVNFVTGVSETLMAGGDLHLQETSEQQLARSFEILVSLPGRNGDMPLLEVAGVLDALIRYALWQGELAAARALADEYIRIARDADFPLLYGRALLDRSRVHSRIGDRDRAIADAEEAVAYFGAGASELWEVRSRELLAAAYAAAGRHREAFEIQLAVTRGVENLFRDYHQQRALVGQVEQQARESEVRAKAFAEAALRDPLTGAPNRTRAMQVLDELHAHAQAGTPSAIALLDLDFFKRVNDTFGHLVGDAVLMKVTQVLGGELRKQDLLARLGGEEFIVILPSVTLEQATAICARLRDALQGAEWDMLTPGMNISGSFGVAVLDGEKDVTGALKAADRALYAAKTAGRNTVITAVGVGPDWRT